MHRWQCTTQIGGDSPYGGEPTLRPLTTAQRHRSGTQTSKEWSRVSCGFDFKVATHTLNKILPLTAIITIHVLCRQFIHMYYIILKWYVFVQYISEWYQQSPYSLIYEALACILLCSTIRVNWPTSDRHCILHACPETLAQICWRMKCHHLVASYGNSVRI